ncbi:unnamed protein product, partial [Polarella glacialis]
IAAVGYRHIPTFRAESPFTLGPVSTDTAAAAAVPELSPLAKARAAQAALAQAAAAQTAEVAEDAAARWQESFDDK